MIFSEGSRIDRYLLNLGPNQSGSKEYRLLQFDEFKDNDQNEYYLLKAFFDLTQKHQADIITGYNIFGFDEKYIFCRMEKLCKKLKLDSIHYKMSRVAGVIKKTLHESRLQSSGLGKNDMKFIESYGLVHVDLMQIIKSKYNFESYSLDSVCQELKVLQIQEIQYAENTIKVVLDKDDIFLKEGKFVVLRF
jgi:DNA polymerase elongation subunit (family B)